MSPPISHRLSSLLRGRYIMSLIGMGIIVYKPELGQWIVALVGLSVGVSAIDAIKNRGSGDGQQG